MSKKRTFKELLQLLPQKEQPEDKAAKEAAEPALQGNEAENAAAAVQHENAYAKLGKAFINRLHLPNELIANASEVESIVNRIISVWEKVEAKTADSAAEENARGSGRRCGCKCRTSAASSRRRPCTGTGSGL